MYDVIQWVKDNESRKKLLNNISEYPYGLEGEEGNTLLWIGGVP